MEVGAADLCLVENSLEAVGEAGTNRWVLWRRVVLEQPEQFHRQPGRWHKIVGVVLQVLVRWRHYLLSGETENLLVTDRQSVTQSEREGQVTLLSLLTASCTQPLYSSGCFLTRASMRLTAAVTTPICWSLSRWTTLDAHSPMCMTSGDVRMSLRRVSAALCFTASIVSLQNETDTSVRAVDQYRGGLAVTDSLSLSITADWHLTAYV